MKNFKRNHRRMAIALGIVFSSASILSACGSGDSPQSSNALPPNNGVVASPAGVLGKQVWATNCQSCHGSLVSKAASAANVRNAINNNKGGMGSIVVTQADLDNLAVYALNPAAY